MTEVLLTKEFGSLRPASDEAYRVLGKIKNGTGIVVDVKDPSRRSVRQHNFWFVIATLLYESQEMYKNFDHFRECLLIRLGRCEMYPQKDGTTIPVAKSIAWSKMDSDEFGKLVDDTLDFAQEMGFDRDTLEAEAKARHGEAGD